MSSILCNLIYTIHPCENSPFSHLSEKVGLMDVSRHPQAEQILRRLQQEKIAVLYHFTSIENLPCIRDMQALCSKQLLEDEGRWPCAAPGGDDLSHSLDSYHGNWEMVSCNFTPRTPMAYHKKQQHHLCFFVIQIDIAAFNGVFFTDANATANGHERAEGLAGIELVNFAAIRSSPRPWDKEGWVRQVQAEVLVPDCIMLDYVIEVTFVSEASLWEAGRLWGLQPHPPFRIEPHHFEDIRSGNPVLTFPVLLDWLLTNESVDKSNYRIPYSHKSHFIRQPGGRITVLAHIRVLAGTRVYIKWYPGEQVTECLFEKSSGYYLWPSIAMDQLPDGPCSVLCYLNDICWAMLEFELVSQRRETL